MALMRESLAALAGRVLRRNIGLAAPFLRTEIPVLTYHSIDESGSLLSVGADAFRAQLATLRAANWRTLTMAEYCSSRAAGRVEPCAVLITFDDGYRNFYELAAPILAEFGFRATVFVAVNFVGERPLWLIRDRTRTHSFLEAVGMTSVERQALMNNTDALLQENLMDWRQLRSLVDTGFDVQSHSTNHHFLTSLSPGALIDDLRRSRSVLQDRLGQPVPAIAYPYGVANRAVAEAARAAEFEQGFVADHSPRFDQRMATWRGGISNHHTGADIISVSRSWPLYPNLRAWRRRRSEGGVT